MKITRFGPDYATMGHPIIEQENGRYVEFEDAVTRAVHEACKSFHKAKYRCPQWGIDDFRNDLRQRLAGKIDD